jgi:hypothetical protein
MLFDEILVICPLILRKYSCKKKPTTSFYISCLEITCDIYIKLTNMQISISSKLYNIVTVIMNIII